EEPLNTLLKTGDEVVLDLDSMMLNLPSGVAVARLKDIGAVRDVIDAGGIFEYARKSGMI
ncbi:MAG: hypothetical protein JW808_00290, partial [Victivallales bacterium]|nr:hypothetical protein [Victivallales bacterium]